MSERGSEGPYRSDFIDVDGNRRSVVCLSIDGDTLGGIRRRFQEMAENRAVSLEVDLEKFHGEGRATMQKMVDEWRELAAALDAILKAGGQDG